MAKAPIPENESQRLAALLNYQILDTEAEAAFDDLTYLASHICGTPIALISLVDRDRQWFKSKVGVAVTETHRDAAFCAHAILQPATLIVPDTQKDDRFATNPLVRGNPHIRFYAGAPLLTPDGFALGTLCVIDQVPRTLAPDQLEALEALSRQVISQLELRHTVNQLVRTNAELDRATRLKDEFLANMSHELRSPLNAILGISESLLDGILGSLNERQRTMIATLESSGNHLLELINDILDLAKIESGKLTLDIAHASISTLCESSLAFIRQAALNKRIQLHCNLPNTLPACQFDLRRMRQVLINLLSNAVKFTPAEGSIYLEGGIKPAGSPVKGRNGEWIAASAPLLWITVRDTGIGISAENQARLFQPFTQIDSQLNRQVGGTGLGLALSQQIADLHGGWITLESQVEQGSCFTVHLPQPHLTEFGVGLLREAATISPVMTDAVSPSDRPSQKEKRRPLVLLAEDNTANQEMLQAYLENKGYQIILAQDGHEAVAIAQSHQPDLILMDIQMPGMDGLEAIHHIRQIPPLVNTPIIALTALAMAGDRDRCLAAGANEYFSKPIQLKALVTAIQTFLPKD